MGAVESGIQSRIIAYLRGLDRTYVYNAGGSASAAKGTPDLLVCHRGRFIGLELKRPEGSYGTTATQKVRIKQIRNAGGVAEVVTSVADVVALLASLDKEE